MFLVTGGAGFIGSHIVERLVEMGEKVRVFDNFSTGKRDNLAGVLDRVEINEGDIRDAQLVRRATDGVQIVLHQAAMPSVLRSIAAPRTTLDVNVSRKKRSVYAAVVRSLGCQASRLSLRRRGDQDKHRVKHQHNRLWIVNHYAVTPDMPGGTRHYELATLLKSHGWTTTIFASPFHYSTRKFVRPVSPMRAMRENVDEVIFRWIYTTPYLSNDWRRYLNMLSFLPMFLVDGLRQTRPHCIIGSSPHPFAALGAWIAARWYRVPFVLEIRDVWPETLVELGLRCPLIVYPLAVLERFLYRRAARIVALTDGIKQRIQAKGIEEKKIVLIPNAAMRPPHLDLERRDQTRRRLGWNGKVVAIWAGAHGTANGLEVIVEAGRCLADREGILIVLVGDGPAKASLKQEAAGLENVVFLDPLPKSEVSDVLRAADIGLLVHRHVDVVQGARPNKLFDFMSAGLPIVSNIGGEAWKLIEAAGAGVRVQPEDPVALAEAIWSMATDPYRQRMGQRGFAYVLQHHSREQTADDLAQLLQEVVAAHARCRSA